MSANTKLSNAQLQILMILYIIGISIVLPLAAGAGLDAWISIMGAVVIGGSIAWGVGWKNHRDIIFLVQFTPWCARFKKLFGV